VIQIRREKREEKSEKRKEKSERIYDIRIGINDIRIFWLRRSQMSVAKEIENITISPIRGDIDEKIERKKKNTTF
jgi:hypothetical protein